jgi:hypothetical protein
LPAEIPSRVSAEFSTTFGSEKKMEVNVNHFKLKSVLMGILVAACLIFSAGSAVADDDFVYRPEFDMIGPITDTLKWIVIIDPRMNNDAQAADEIGLIGGVSYIPAKWVTFTADYKYISKGGTDEKNEERPRLAVEFFAPVWKLNVALRGRAEYRMKENQDEYWRYRGRIKIKFPKIGKVTPFIYEEILYEAGDIDETNRNEAGGGVSIPLAKNLGLDVDLRFQNNKVNDDWETADKHLLTVFKYEFK